jgi:hypothetical protein
MADITKSTISALAVAANTARVAERAGYVQLMAGQIGPEGYRALKAALDAATLARAAELDAYAAAAFAALSTDLTGDNNDLTFTAVVSGAGGEDITVQYVDPAGETAAETVAVTGTAIKVTLRSVSAVLSTGAQVKAALDAAPAVGYLITTALKTGNTGAGVVIAMDATALALA